MPEHAEDRPPPPSEARLIDGQDRPRSDARLWAYLVDEFRAAGVARDPALRYARRAVAVVRRESSASGVRTFAPGDTIPYDVAEVYDLDGDVWTRQAADPDDTLRDSWRMIGYDPDAHESAAGGMWVTPYLLDRYGPLTEVAVWVAR